MKAIFACFNCRTKSGNKIREIDHYQIIECKRCGLLITRLPATYDLIKANKACYSNMYLTNYAARESYLKKRFLARLRDIETYKRYGGNLLDVGCSIGLFLKIVSENSKHKWRLLGIDINGRAIHIAKTLSKANFHKASLRNARFDNNFFDCITCFDVLEHDSKINENLQSIKRILKKNGLLVIQLPNYRSLMAYLCGQNWDWWSVPDHILHFSPPVVSTKLADSGFVIKKMFTWEPAKEFVENIRGSIKKNVTKFMSLNKIFSKVSIIPLYLLWGVLQLVEKKFDIGGLIVIYAVKK